MLFGQRALNRRRRPQEEMPLLPMEDIALETPAPEVNVRQGQFGAGKQKRNDLAWWSAGLSDIGSALGGSSGTRLDDFYAQEEKAQADADWAAQLDGMNLTPEVRTFAEANPSAFQEMQFKDSLAKKTKDEQMGLLSGLNLSPEMMALASLNPGGFMEEAGKDAGSTQTDTHFNPVTGQWNRKPIMGQNGDSLFEWDGVNAPVFEQRPIAYDEAETARKNRATENLTSRELGIRDRNARTAELNAGPGPQRGSIIDDTSAPRIPGEDIRYTPRQDGGAVIDGFMGGRVVKVAIGPDGNYAATEGDPAIPEGSAFPAPRYNTITGLGNKAGPNINAEQKKLNEVRAARDAAENLKNLTDKYITQSEGYPFGSMIWDTALQATNPKTAGLEGLNAQMALEIGKMAKGAMSDADRQWFILAAPNAKGKPESNAVFAMRANAVANDAAQYAQYIQNYMAEHGQGSLAEAMRYWDQYALANPIFDDNGDAIEDRKTYYEFFTGKKPPTNPYARDYPGARGNKGGGLSKAEESELEQLRRELGGQ